VAQQKLAEPIAGAQIELADAPVWRQCEHALSAYYSRMALLLKRSHNRIQGLGGRREFIGKDGFSAARGGSCASS
jgi:hypothetical protein